MIPRLRIAFAVAIASAIAGSAFGQAQGLKLQRAIGPPAAGGSGELPTFVIADRLEGVSEQEVDAVGNAELRQGTTTLAADRIQYLVTDDEAEATGNVRLNAKGDRVSGPRLRLRVGDSTGIFESPTFQLAPRAIGRGTGESEGRGTARVLRFEGEDRYRITDGSFTTCKPGQDDWYVRASEFELDMTREVGTARDASVEFLGVETPKLPWFNFSLNNARKTGFLPPVFGIQSNNGPEVAVPFYWNIAPNYDATLTTRYMERRGLQFLTQGRYLDPKYVGVARLEVLPHDKELDAERWAYSWQHLFNYDNRWSGNININRVSDDNYFRDLSGRVSIATQVFLPREGTVTYGSPTGLWNASARIQKWQVLQDSQNPVQQPYNRDPQLTFNFLKQVVGGFDAGLNADFTQFTVFQSGLPTGTRAIAYPYVSYPFIQPGGYITPKVGVNWTTYSLSNVDPLTTPTTQTRSLPIASLDSGLYFDRDTALFGQSYQQTFEPRLYYLYVPYRNQSQIPLFDTSVADLSYASLFAENVYSGPDRISNANQVTITATTRLILPSTGQEVARALLGQRYYFTQQQVALNSTTPLRTNSTSAVLGGIAGRLAQSWTAEAAVQYAFSSNSFANGMQRATVGARYSPERAQILNVGYRYTAAGVTTTGQEINQAEVSGQWPLGRGWYAVGRANYDLVGKQFTEALAGLEYNAGCWILRGVVQSFVTATDQRTNLFFLQIELDGLARIGSSPLEALRRNIPGYSRLGRGGNLDVSPFGGPATPRDTIGIGGMDY